MQNLPARAGIAWIMEGFALFRRQPGPLFSLFTVYFLFMLAVQLIPLVGAVLSFVLLPVMSMVFMQACAQVEQDQQVHPKLLLDAFRSPSLPALLKLGSLYPIATIVAGAASILVDGGTFVDLLIGKVALDSKEAQEPAVMLAMLFAVLVYVPAAMAFWYAAPLMSWQQMGLGKALFYSFFAVLRRIKSFLIYMFGWFVIALLLRILTSALIAPLFGQQAAVIVLLMLMPVVSLIMYCSFYPTYTQVFGKPESVPDTTE